MGTECGAALRIQLTAHALRVYSTDTIYATPAEAKVACATVALNQDVLEYIKYGNGQTQPSPEGPPPESTNDTPAAESPALSLQQFYETLPRPFPEIAGDITAAEINAPTWLNTTAQASRGGRLKLSFLWLSDGALGRESSSRYFKLICSSDDLCHVQSMAASSASSSPGTASLTW